MRKTNEIYLAGGCFWGVEYYFSLVNGVTFTEVGYINGHTKNPTYREVCDGDTGYAEAVKILYDPAIISLQYILELFYKIIDPTLINRQGYDIGTQYRTGIYYTSDEQRAVAEKSLHDLQVAYVEPIVVELLPVVEYYAAEDYHQKYLHKNPQGYCHISSAKFNYARQAQDRLLRYQPKSKEELKKILTAEQYAVTQENETERPFQNEHFANFRAGIYVDVTTGEPLFASANKFDAGCGWPSFTKPITESLLRMIPDKSLGMCRTEVRSAIGNAHLGHVFDDGPLHSGGKRYCINSAAIRFIPKESMEMEGYGDLIYLVK